jgi:hypothetical protein
MWDAFDRPKIRYYVLGIRVEAEDDIRNVDFFLNVSTYIFFGVQHTVLALRLVHRDLASVNCNSYLPTGRQVHYSVASTAE